MSTISVQLTLLTRSGAEEQLGKVTLPEVPFPGDELVTQYGVLRAVRRSYVVPSEGFAGAILWVHRHRHENEDVGG